MKKIKVLRKKIKSILSAPFAAIDNLFYYLSHRNLLGKTKIIYALTPPPRWKDIGDHAQTIAIRQWIEKHYPGVPVIEIDKDKSRRYINALKKLTDPEDLILLQSGGNLGDRGMWSESIRRLIIQSFPDNMIVSLPQTVFFSDTEKGRMEKQNTIRIYGEHKNLTIFVRDPKSEVNAREMFPKARIFCMPDFVLSLKPKLSQGINNPKKVLLVIRKDNESFIGPEKRKALSELIHYRSEYFDTVNRDPVKEKIRDDVLEKCLDVFRSYDAVVTDRFHGLIFSVICHRPCVALRSIDHKLTSGIHWFKSVKFVRFADDISDVPGLLEECLYVEDFEIPDFESVYFDTMPELIGWGKPES
jgi:pyruvyl transferase EpsI